MKEKKPKSGMSRIFELASDHKWLLAVSGVLAALAAIASFVPYVAVYYVIRDVISVYPEFNKLNIESVLGYGMIAIIGIAAFNVRINSAERGTGVDRIRSEKRTPPAQARRYFSSSGSATTPSFCTPAARTSAMTLTTVP